MKKYLSNPVLDLISRIAGENNTELYIVGGYVRDIILNRPTNDLDIVVVGNGIEFARKLASAIGGSTNVSVFKNFGTAMLSYRNYEIEFVGARKESYRRESRKPIVEDGTLQDDLQRRDFTINALAVGLGKNNYGELIDPFKGVEDIKNKVIRTPLDPEVTFSDDPLRMMRAIRFASRLKFSIDELTTDAIRKHRERIGIVSQERITEEINKIILSEKPSIGFKLMDQTGLLEIILPEVFAMKGVDMMNGKMHKDNFYHTIKVLDNLCKKSDNLWLRWAALLHDVGKPGTKKYDKYTGWTFHGHDYLGSKMVPAIFKRLKLPLNEKMKYVRKIVRLHLRPISLSGEEITDSAVRRLLYEAGDQIEDLMILCEADITSKNKETVRRHMNNFRIVRKKLREIEEKDAVRNFQPPVRGDEIMAIFGLSPCKEIGIIKQAIKDAILDGIIRNDRDEAVNFMLNKAKEMGIEPLEGTDPGNLRRGEN